MVGGAISQLTKWGNKCRHELKVTTFITDQENMVANKSKGVIFGTKLVKVHVKFIRIVKQ